MAYYSPELVRYINNPGARDRLSGASDVFALGLVYSEWLTGRKPGFDRDARYAGVAAARGDRLTVDGIPNAELTDLVEAMVAEVPSQRPAADRVHAILRAVRDAKSTDLGAVGASGGGTAGDSSTGLRGSLLKKGCYSISTETERASTLRGSLVKKAARE